jgi:transcriptional antiterminator RfaH
VLSWFAVYTKPRSEELARGHLARQGFDCLLPRLKRVLRASGGMQQRIEALFPRYLFLRVNPDLESLAVVRSTRGVCGLVRAGLEPVRVPQHVIDGILHRIDDDTSCVRLDPPALAPGCRVRVSDGPFAGFEAVFKAACGRDRVRLLLSLLGLQSEVVVPRVQLAAHL